MLASKYWEKKSFVTESLDDEKYSSDSDEEDDFEELVKSVYKHDKNGTVKSLLYLGRLYTFFGNIDEAKGYYTKALNKGSVLAASILSMFKLPFDIISEKECYFCSEKTKICKLKCSHFLCYSCVCKINISDVRQCPECNDNF